ncbi:MAG: hypothetical protein DHS20C14_20460 [Phycisphaeraceae bacterium]|nr:MAG: hypothetical protein DHS20C14_20460 [Phycisphaeraceae bacterium]
MSRRTHTRFAAALAGSAFSTLCGAQVSLLIHADKSSVSIGDTVTWTLEASGFSISEYFQAYDLNILASDDALATASAFETALSLIINPTPGAPSGASLLGVTGGQSSALDPFGLVFGGPITLGSFTVTAQDPGALTYTVEDGGLYGTTDTLRIGNTCFCPASPNGPPEIFVSDTVTIVPAPASALILIGLALPGRRRR